MAPSPAIAFSPVEKARVRAVALSRLTGRPPKPTTVGRYRLLERIGHGASGIVYRAYDPALRRELALKLVHAPTHAGAQQVLREAHALARLSHPNVVTVFDAGVAENTVYIAMELVCGPTLEGWFSAQPRTEIETIATMLDAGRGLAAAHAADLVHRDFKPSNVMVGEDGRVRVLDFGLVRPQVALTSRDTSSHGTPGYMAPEQARGEVPTHHSDQFSFCVTFHEALTRRRPSGSPLARRWLQCVKPIIARGLHPKAALRHPSMAALIRRFERRRVLSAGAGLAGAAAVGASVTSLLLQ